MRPRFPALVCSLVVLLTACSAPMDSGDGESVSSSVKNAASSASSRSAAAGTAGSAATDPGSPGAGTMSSSSAAPFFSIRSSAGSSVTAMQASSVPDTGAGSDTGHDPSEGNVQVQIEADRQEARPGDQVTYRLKVRSVRPAPLSAVRLVFSFPPNQFSVLETDGQSQAGFVQWVIDRLEPGQTRSVQIRGVLSSALKPKETFQATLLAAIDNVVEPNAATIRTGIIQNLPRTGPSDALSPLESTSRFLRPVSSSSAPLLPAIVWAATVIMGVAVGGSLMRRK